MFRYRRFMLGLEEEAQRQRRRLAEERAKTRREMRRRHLLDCACAAFQNAAAGLPPQQAALGSPTSPTSPNDPHPLPLPPPDTAPQAIEERVLRIQKVNNSLGLSIVAAKVRS